VRGDHYHAVPRAARPDEPRKGYRPGRKTQQRRGKK